MSCLQVKERGHSELPLILLSTLLRQYWELMSSTLVGLWKRLQTWVSLRCSALQVSWTGGGKIRQFMATRRTAMNRNLRVMCKINNLQEVEAEYINKRTRGQWWKRWKMKKNWGWLFGVGLSECRFMNIAISCSRNKLLIIPSSYQLCTLVAKLCQSSQQQLQMNQQNNGQTLDQASTIEDNRILLDKQLLAKKKELIQQFLKNQEETNDILINYPNDFLQKLAVSQLKQFGKLLFYKSIATLYFGDVCNELYHGYGLLIYKQNNLRFYEGYFQNNCKYGYGLEYINGDVFVGKFVNNKPEDQNGIFIWANEDIYHGSFVSGMKHGQGKWQSGEEFYSGSWKYNKPEGEGFIRSALSQYKGDVKNGYKHGKGFELFNNGDRYDGTYSNGKPQGYGTYYWSNGSVYKGEFKNGLRFGNGVWQLGSEKYEGNYINDKRNGEGKYTWGGGSYYIGSFVEDLRHGYGQMHWEEDSYYKGEWFEGSQNGEGEVWEAGKLIQKGVYENGKLKVVSNEESERRILPLNTLNKRGNNQGVQSFPTDRKRFNSFQVNHKESVKLQKLSSHRTTNQINSPNKNAQKRERLKQVNQRYSALAKKAVAQPTARSFRASNNLQLNKISQNSKQKQQKSGKFSMNKINLYKRLRKQKQSDSTTKKTPLTKLSKSIESDIMFQTQLAPIKWKNFNHINHG